MADTVERRAWPRVDTGTRLEMARGKLRPGRLAQIVDVSSGGALIETEWRLLPGTRVDLQVGEPVALYHVKARILRCHVARLDGERIRFRGALVFEEPLAFGGNEEPGGGSSFPRAIAAHIKRAGREGTGYPERELRDARK